jgi:hypothetical protein
MSTKMQVEWRRAKVLELLNKGDNQSEIAKVLHSQKTIANLKSSPSNSNEESKEPDYDDQLGEEQEEETGEVTANQVF